jgi:SAM-dependent methyltransferase
MITRADVLRVNSGQRELWNGRAGQIWIRLQIRLDRAFEPLTRTLIEAAEPGPGEKIIDIGCGCGDLSLSLAKKVGRKGHVLGVDFSGPMIERAQRRYAELCRAEASLMSGGPEDACPSNLTWLNADAMTYGFTEEADLVASRFGVMFFADPVAALANIARALKPGGRLALLCWAAQNENPWINEPLASVLELLGAPEMRDSAAPGPYAFAEPRCVCDILTRAGFAEASARYVTADLLIGQAANFDAEQGSVASKTMIEDVVDDALVLLLESGPIAALLRDADEAILKKVRSSVAEVLRPHARTGEIRLGAACWLYRASKPWQ